MRIICFHNSDEENGFLSNWYLSTFIVNGMKFSSVEQYIMYRKAVASKIMATDDVADIKALGRSVSCYDDTVWCEIREKVVLDALQAKFSQNSYLKQQLLDTGDSILTECAVKDMIWGISLSMKDSNRFDLTKWRGRNLLGKLLMKVRETLR